MDKINFMLAGVGGQGTLLAGNILADVGLAAGYDAKKSEIHGMAQRGGSVTTHVRWAPRVDAPMAGKGEIDILVGFEQLEALRYIEYVRPGGRALLSTHKIPPVAVTSGGAAYPNEARFKGVIEQVTKEYVLVPAVEIARELGNARVHNVVLLGALSCWLDVPAAIWLDVIERHVPAKALELNRAAFAKGREFNSASQ
jgi:indolepyruvate ferredoxin oxidoreductase, beta subunit